MQRVQSVVQWALTRGRCDVPDRLQGALGQRDPVVSSRCVADDRFLWFSSVTGDLMPLRTLVSLVRMAPLTSNRVT